MADVPKSVELVLDRPRSIFYDFRVGNEWEKEMFKSELSERKELGLSIEQCVKRDFSTCKLSGSTDLPMLLWVILRRRDPTLTFQATAELVNMNNAVEVQDAIATAMNTKIDRRTKEQKEADAKAGKETDAKNSNPPTGSDSGPSVAGTSS